MSPDQVRISTPPMRINNQYVCRLDQLPHVSWATLIGRLTNWLMSCHSSWYRGSLIVVTTDVLII